MRWSSHVPIALLSPLSDLAAGVTAFTFGVLAVLALLWGILHLSLGAHFPSFRTLATAPAARPCGHQSGAVSLWYGTRRVCVLGVVDSRRGGCCSRFDPVRGPKGPRYESYDASSVTRTFRSATGEPRDTRHGARTVGQRRRVPGTRAMLRGLFSPRGRTFTTATGPLIAAVDPAVPRLGVHGPQRRTRASPAIRHAVRNRDRTPPRP